MNSQLLTDRLCDFQCRNFLSKIFKFGVERMFVRRTAQNPTLHRFSTFRRALILILNFILIYAFISAENLNMSAEFTTRRISFRRYFI